MMHGKAVATGENVINNITSDLWDLVVIVSLVVIDRLLSQLFFFFFFFNFKFQLPETEFTWQMRQFLCSVQDK